MTESKMLTKKEVLEIQKDWQETQQDSDNSTYSFYDDIAGLCHTVLELHRLRKEEAERAEITLRAARTILDADIDYFKAIAEGE